ncbi:hypothetical protein FKP32DRAFT_1592694 [Trametes sanguinea]|nr:hypothetical protein FKP32DRAFT_1592694 [Trametes sanguinea]
MALVDRDRIAAVTARRVHTLRAEEPTRLLYTNHDSEWTVRQEFRKRIDRDILATNSPKEAIESLEAVLSLAENILTQPDAPKFRRFRVRNERIKRVIVQPKGVLQLVVDLGFREKTEDLETYYAFSGRRTNELRIGALIIKEVLERERKAQEEEETRRAREEEEKQAHLVKQRQLFLDDRCKQNARARARLQPTEHMVQVPTGLTTKNSNGRR